MFVLIDKPKGISSHDVVNKVRRISGEKKVGHAGTLDPMATGLLVVGIGKQSTKKLGEISKNTKKTYEAEIFLGEERDTGDSEGRVVSRNEAIIPSKIDVKEVLAGFVGHIEQIPPSYSAIKIKGVKAYHLARKGKVVNLQPRGVVVYSIKLVDYFYPLLKIICEVSSGTYVRALARDIGQKLGTGAYLKNLRRTRIGKYKLEEATPIDHLKEENWKEHLTDL